MEILRRKLIYELFIEQFLDMAQVSLKYRSLQQTMELLKQTERLCLLLTDDKFNEEAEKHRETIELFKLSLQKLISDSPTGPELPRRESLAAREAIRIRYRPERLNTPISSRTSVASSSFVEEIPSDDDNDEIYNYHQSVIAQIHSTSAENLARFQHTDECDDDSDGITGSMENLEITLSKKNISYESVYDTTKL